MTKKTAYDLLGDGVRLADKQLKFLQKQQKRLVAEKKFDDATDLTAQIANLVRALTNMQAEIRKTDEEAKKQYDHYTEEQKTELALQLIETLSPDMRAAISKYIEELGDKLFN